ncbi:MAG: ribosome assembly RNA-binding protein YhbY [Lachnospiraceae bacterium]|nr:ribosome assembly RNA-binding protein YhbY [Lachnospiraceae bacterium]
MTSKQRSYLKGLAMNIDPIVQVGKGGVTPELCAGVEECFHTRELIKLNVLKNCLDDPKALAQTIAEHTRSQVVQVIGRKIVLYKQDRDNPKIVLPR